MQYEIFESKVKKFEDFLKLIVKHLVKVSIAAAIVLGVTITLLITKGMILGSASGPTEISYGEELQFKVRAFLSRVNYEYFDLSTGQWTEQAPIAPGDYQVRGVSNATIGHRYSDAKSFSIVPLKIKVKVQEKSIVHGDLPTAIGETVYGDRIECTDFIYNENRTQVKVDISKVRIYDENDNDVTDRYKLEAVNCPITYQPRPVTLESPGAEKVYDGEKLDLDEYTVTSGSFAEGDRVTCTYEGGITDAGVAENIFTVKIHSSKGEDVTRFYNISYIYGTLTVKQRPLSYETPGGSFTYDDTYHTFEDITFGESGKDVGLVDGQRIEVNYYPSFRFVSDSGANEIGISIFDGHTDVTHNYSITPTYGKVTVLPRTLNVKTNSISGMYNDTEYYDHSIEFTNPEALCRGHWIEVDYSSARFIDAISNGENKVLFTVWGYDGDMTANYDIIGDYGSVNISKRPISFTSASYEGVYDGYGHGGGLVWLSGELCYGHEIEITHEPEFKDVVYEAENIIEVKIVKNGTKDVTHNYEIDFDPGIITITPKIVYITTGSMTWEYDGKPHQCKGYEVVDSEFIDFHTVEVADSTTITKVGRMENVVTLSVLDENENDVTSNYDIRTLKYGILEITGDPEEEDKDEDKEVIPPGEGGGGPLSEDGKLGLGEYAEGGGAAATAFYVYSDTTGSIYLKLKSFGDLNGTTWAEAPEYGILFEASVGGKKGQFAAAYLTSMALKSAGKGEGYMRITSVYNQYVLPYFFSVNGTYPQISDTRANGDASVEYELYYYSWDYTPGYYSVPEEYRKYEEAYSKFVHDNYTSINDSKTREYLERLIAREGFDRYDPYVIEKVAAYIQQAAVYSMKYDRALDSREDIVVAFLDEYKEGICQHYATAATMLYRALGIPARYTIGYVGATEAGKVTEVSSKNGHAWVEVYIDGLGWINVEVTGSGPDTGDPIPGGGGDVKKETIKVTPTYQYKVYDGTPLVANNEISELDPVLSALLAQGYTYEVTVSGIQDGAGKSNSKVTSFILYDPDENVVTDQFNIVYVDGVLEVGKGVIKIYLYEKTFDYNGSFFYYDFDEFAVIEAPYNVEFVMNSVNISMKNAGSLSSNEINKDIRWYLDYSIYADGSYVDEWENYVVTVVNFIDGGEYIPFTINEREITITTGSEIKYYDGEPLTNGTAYVSKGKLADGHSFEIKVIGEITAAGSAPNTVDISSLIIYDEFGGNVTKNYIVSYELGNLIVLE